MRLPTPACAVDFNFRATCAVTTTRRTLCVACVARMQLVEIACKHIKTCRALLERALLTGAVCAASLALVPVRIALSALTAMAELGKPLGEESSAESVEATPTGPFGAIRKQLQALGQRRRPYAKHHVDSQIQQLLELIRVKEKVRWEPRLCLQVAGRARMPAQTTRRTSCRRSWRSTRSGRKWRRARARSSTACAPCDGAQC